MTVVSAAIPTNMASGDLSSVTQRYNERVNEYDAPPEPAKRSALLRNAQATPSRRPPY
jgi:hypothetical protein